MFCASCILVGGNAKILSLHSDTGRSIKFPQDYKQNYRIVSRDFILPKTNKGFRFIVKQNKETMETRCFDSTHIDYRPVKILNSYHIRWPVESGIKDLIETTL